MNNTQPMMQARVINGAEAGFNALVYQQPDQNLLSYLKNSINTASQIIGNAGSSLIENARSVYERYNSDSVINATKALLLNVDSHLNPDAILRYNEETLATATPYMQQYIMVHPELWKLNNDQLCNGFNGTYLNTEPDIKTYEEHTKYQEVMDGMIRYDDDSDDAYFVTYSGSEINELNTVDQFSIIDTWQAVSNLIADDVDPSDPDGGNL